MAELADDGKPEPLNADGKTASGKVGCVMLHTTGSTADSHWFQCRLSLYGDRLVIEWPNDTMSAVLEADVVSGLISNRWARPMTVPEIASYNESIKPKGELT